MKHGSLFSGIGGFDLAAEWMGWENKFHCEWNPFGQRVLKHYWPNAESFEDITKTDFSKYHGTIDIISGGFPCQPYSQAGKRLGKEDERHLWPEMLRCIREVAPRFVVGENVRGLVNWNGGMVFDEVCADLENLAYQVAPVVIPASSVNAPHQRERIWFIAHTNNKRLEGNAKKRISKNEGGKNTIFNGIIAGLGESSKWRKFPIESAICSGNDGIPTKLDAITFSKWRKESLMAYGNAIVPQVAFEIFKVLQQFEDENN